MRASVVHVTDHALLRWRERAAVRADANVYDVIEAVKQSKVLRDHEPLPYPLPRLPNSVYSVKDDVLFVMEPITIEEYRLVTVVTKCAPHTLNHKPNRAKGTVKNEEPVFQTALEERNWLIAEKRKLENELAVTPKRTPKHAELKRRWAGIESRLLANKPKAMAEKQASHEEYMRTVKQEKPMAAVLDQILQGINDLKQILNKKNGSS